MSAPFTVKGEILLIHDIYTVYITKLNYKMLNWLLEQIYLKCKVHWDFSIKMSLQDFHKH